jgi:hypothetical protein
MKLTGIDATLVTINVLFMNRIRHIKYLISIIGFLLSFLSLINNEWLYLEQI